jgi:hypothetical protein
MQTFIITSVVLVAGAVGGGFWSYSQNPAVLTELQLKLGLLSETEAGDVQRDFDYPAVLTQLQLELGLLNEAEASGVHSVSGYIEAEEVNIAADYPNYG